MKEEYRHLINSSRVSRQTRAVLNERSRSYTAEDQSALLSHAELATLRSVIAHVIPQNEHFGSNIIDIAVQMDLTLSEATGDGWRYATLPNDADACRLGLRLLDEFAKNPDGRSFGELDPEAQDGLLEGIASGRIVFGQLDLQRWFEDLRTNATRIYVSHPETLAQMGYSGIADEPDGFVQLGVGQSEAWEPKEQ